MGQTNARFQIVGNTELLIQKLKTCVTAGRINRSIDRRKLIEKPSTPKAEDFIRKKACRTDDSVTGTNLNSGKSNNLRLFSISVSVRNLEKK
jgi:hypothetical protein